MPNKSELPVSPPEAPVSPPVEGHKEEDHEEAIRQRAYEISQSGDAGSPEENWHRAERELAQDA